MTTTIVLNGNSYTYPTDFIGTDGYAYADTWESFYGDLTAELQRTRGAGLTSSTAITPATGTQVFTTDQNATDVVIPASALLIIESASNSAKKMVGSVTSFSTNTLTMSITYASDGGDSPSEGNDWIIYYPSSTVISTLTSIASLATDDELVVSDTSAGANKKITWANVLASVFAGGTFTGDIAMGGNAITGAEGVADIGGAVQVIGTTASNVTLDLSTYGAATFEPTGNITIAASNYPAGESAHTLVITGGGDHTLDFSHYANAADLPTLQTTTGGDILIGYSPDGGTTKLIYQKGTF